MTYIPTAPVIAAQPQSRSVSLGQSAIFSVSASGDSLSYQWHKNGGPIGGATGPSLTIGSVQPADAGSCQVKVSNPGGRCGAAL